MARLNDFMAPTESIDALKRRFVRQNREIARVNSMQSLRIRSLESEVSHLLSENVSLREQVITLGQEIERLEAAKMLHNGVYEIKSRLDAKLAELSNLATDLGMLPRKVGKLCDAQSAPADSDQGEDGRLPAILEDKFYPRRTLEPQELQDLVRDDDISEPPLESTLTQDRSALKVEDPTLELPENSSASPTGFNEAEDPEPVLPPTLETRKKKKKSDAPLFHESVEHREQPNPGGDTEPTSKPGSKRKFSPEDDGDFMSSLVGEDDEFQFNRPSHSPSKRTEPSRQDHSPSKKHVDIKKGSATQTLARRKVLEPSMNGLPPFISYESLLTTRTESANANLGSPKKSRSSLARNHKASRPVSENGDNTASSEKCKDIEKHDNSVTQKARRPGPGHVSHKQKRASRSDKDEPIQSQPTFPHEISAVQTQQPIPEVSGVSAASRPSRRQRGVVSYAEPNLRDKMRRPTKNMIDAVAGDRSRRSSSFQPGQEGDAEEAQWDDQMRIGNSLGRSSGKLPADLALADHGSDIFCNDSTSEQYLKMVSQRKRKVSSTIKDNGTYNMPTEDANGGTGATGIDVDASLASLSAKSSKETSGSRRQTRRHSSNPRATGPTVSSQDAMDQDEAQATIWTNSSTGMSTSFLPVECSPEEEELQDSAIDASHMRRGHRVAARRKSMML
ncbi:hypothetical protein NUU61_007605 [Penicillium alfredii]|uniref:Shugoshin n=1 Tax=Penicillium alfredii TaxID=1506179 RepID=A0A9W9EQS5_9EURO|nr:uncharacterized protein NUU61_007605 [Penicillium alfredii]KAJ5086298.1 hypothetical protein NUU61_007605 [Penicillium alfredii]